jgi:transcriptional regulator with XRE-family HTH domain
MAELEGLKQYFKEQGITTKEISERTGYSIGYVRNLLNTSNDFNDRARYRFLRAFPDIKPLLGSDNNKGNDLT